MLSWELFIDGSDVREYGFRGATVAGGAPTVSSYARRHRIVKGFYAQSENGELDAAAFPRLRI